MLRFSLLAVAACNFPSPMLAQDGAPADARIDASADALPDTDAGPSACEQHWLDGSVTFGAPAPLTELSDGTGDAWHPFLTVDEKTIFYAVFQGGNIASNDIYTATRTAVGAQFGTPTIASNFTSATDDTRVAIADDGLIAVIARNDASDADRPILWYGARSSTQNSFAFSKAKVGAVNTHKYQFDPNLSPDGRTLTFAAGDGLFQIYVATRPDTVSDFGDPALVDLAMPSHSLSGPALSRDGRVLVVNVDSSLTYATRASATGTFGALTPVPFTGATTANTPFLGADTCRVYAGTENTPRVIQVATQIE